MKKLLALIMSLLMVLFVLSACADNKDTDPEVSTSEQSETQPSTEGPRVDAGGYLLDDVPDGLNFNETVTILYWSDVEMPEFFVEEMMGDNVDDAIYNRNLDTETRLGIKLEWVGEKGNYDNRANFVNKAQNSVNSGGEYDIFAGYSMTGATLAVNGLAQDLNTLDYLDFSKPWWPESLIGQATMNGKLYFASGDISTNMLHMMYAVFFNKQMLTDFDLENPYELVQNGKWTYTKMFEMATDIYMSSGSPTPTIDDRYGFATSAIHFDAFFTGAGFTTIEKDANGRLMISPLFNTERTVKLLEDICDFMWNSGDAYYGATGDIFRRGNTLFTLDRSYMALLRKDEITFDYGILPVPKFEEAQEKYVTCLGFPYTMYSISIASKIPTATAATLEVLCSEAYRKTTPMLFENTMKYRYTSDNESAQMYDIIRESVSIDIGRIFSMELQEQSWRIFRTACQNNAASSWSSSYKSGAKIIDAALRKINDSLDKLDG